LHGLFTADDFRASFIGDLASQDFNYAADVEAVLDKLASHLETHMDLDLLFELAEPVAP
jgi:adenosylcobyric acid synthase